MAKKRNRKGSVGVESDRGWLRLRMPANYSPRYKYLNYRDTQTNRQKAVEMARKIEAEITLNPDHSTF